MAIYKIPAPARGCYTGAFFGEGAPTSLSIKNFYDKTQKTPAIMMWFHAFAQGFEFPKEAFEIVELNGGIPFIKLEPWSWKKEGDDSFSLDKILAGKFDDGIRGFAAQGQTTGTPYFISFGHEMNGNWYPWAGDPKKYVAAYRRVFELFKETKAENHTWVFNPNVGPLSKIKAYYPGDKFVDWIALDGFNWGTSKPWSKWMTFEDIFKASYRGICNLSREKPVMIGEFASSPLGGDKAEWIRQALASIRKMDRIRAFVWFDLDKPEETDWRIDTSAQTLRAFQQAVKDPYFI